MAEISLSNNALKVLRVLLERASDGYQLMSGTGLDAAQLAGAARELQASEMIDASGSLDPQRICEARLWVRPNAKRYGDFLLKQARL